MESVITRITLFKKHNEWSDLLTEAVETRMHAKQNRYTVPIDQGRD